VKRDKFEEVKSQLVAIEEILYAIKIMQNVITETITDINEVLKDA
jgi:hypothetical protein